MRVVCRSQRLYHHKAICAFIYGLEKSSKVDIDYFDRKDIPQVPEDRRGAREESQLQPGHRARAAPP